jgi:hypothetical protein
MMTLTKKVMWTARAKVFAADLAGALTLTLGAATVALSPQFEPASAQAGGEVTEPSANGQKATVKGSQQQRLVGEVFSRTELYFGSGKPGPDVTRRQFDRFVDREVTPRFPDGRREGEPRDPGDPQRLQG